MYFRNEHHRQAFRDGMKKTKTVVFLNRWKMHSNIR
mgnify:CR=1 FL=1